MFFKSSLIEPGFQLLHYFCVRLMRSWQAYNCLCLNTLTRVYPQPSENFPWKDLLKTTWAVQRSLYKTLSNIFEQVFNKWHLFTVATVFLVFVHLQTWWKIAVVFSWVFIKLCPLFVLIKYFQAEFLTVLHPVES